MAVTTGFIGLGAMGAGMAKCLLKAGIPLVVHDRDPAKLAHFHDAGAEVAGSAAEVASRCGRTICMVETTIQVHDVLLGERGLAKSAAPGHRVACMSTIDPEAVRLMHAALAARDIALIDAPVSGGTERAEKGTLAIFVGGDPLVLRDFDDCFHAMGEHVFHMGGITQGMAIKLVNNMLMQVNSVAVAEAMALAARAGLDLQTVVDVVKVSTGNSVAFEMRAPRIVSRDFAPGGTLDISYKDQELETAFAKTLGMPVFLANVSQQIYQIGRSMGHAKEDAASLIKVYETLGGTDRQA